jgi:hypothetical protein
MNSVYDDKVLHEAIRNFIDAGRIATSPEMRLVCHGLASLAFSINELQKRVHFVEEKVGVSPMRGFENLLSPPTQRITENACDALQGYQE